MKYYFLLTKGCSILTKSRNIFTKGCFIFTKSRKIFRMPDMIKILLLLPDLKQNKRRMCLYYNRL
ncbi:MAG: hypothetical protein LBL74_00820 [Bacteroidales bacterium]|nr:hypothetical protein [Bacteroidales bacterium]